MLWNNGTKTVQPEPFGDEWYGKYWQICVPSTVERNQKISSKYCNWQLLSTELSKVGSFQGATDNVTHNEGSKLVLFVKGHIKLGGHTI